MKILKDGDTLIKIWIGLFKSDHGATNRDLENVLSTVHWITEIL